MELICGACHGRLLAESPGTTVACPHCGTFLQTPVGRASEDPAPLFSETDDHDSPVPNPEEDTIRLEPWEVPGRDARAAPAPETYRDVPSSAESAVAAPKPSPFELAPAEQGAPPFIEVSESGSVKVSSAEAAQAAQDDAEIAHKTTVVAVEPRPIASESALAIDAVAASAVPSSVDVVALARDAAIESAGERVFAPVDRSIEHGAAFPGKRHGSADRPAESPVSPGVSPLLFKFVVSYASAVTLLCVYLGWLVMTNPSTLDLPDMPVNEYDKKVSMWKYLPPNKQVPAAHVLRLGQSRRFGSLSVTPLRVTRGPVEFSFYDPDSEETRAPEGPVLKLHLRFANVSKDQEFVPLDRRLVYTKEPDRREYGVFKANNFVCREGERSRLANHVFVFDMSPDSEWIMNGQNLDRELKPGESVETFVATTTEQIETLSGQLVWRVHFRKGYNRDSHRGVTTLIEVLFQSSEIVDEGSAPARKAGPETKEA
jgi:hypothetical protein